MFGTHTLPELSIATSAGPLKFDPGGAKLPYGVPSLLSAVTVLGVAPRRGGCLRVGADRLHHEVRQLGATGQPVTRPTRPIGNDRAQCSLCADYGHDIRP
jgi:hypothetical protein